MEQEFGNRGLHREFSSVDPCGRVQLPYVWLRHCGYWTPYQYSLLLLDSIAGKIARRQIGIGQRFKSECERRRTAHTQCLKNREDEES